MNGTMAALANRTDEATLRREVVRVLGQLGIAGRFVDVEADASDEFGHLALSYDAPARPERELELAGLLGRLQGVVGGPLGQGRVVVLRYRR